MEGITFIKGIGATEGFSESEIKELKKLDI